jgi:hypothetical protein
MTRAITLILGLTTLAGCGDEETIGADASDQNPVHVSE